MDTYFEFGVLTQRPEKPRRRGVTIMKDTGMGLSGVKDFLDVLGEYVDYVKHPNIFGLRIKKDDPDDIVVQKNRIYRENQIETIPGGIVFELAVAKNCLESTYEKMIELHFSAVEISDNAVDMTVEEKIAAVRLARTNGLKVMFEYGKKDADAPLEVEPVAAEMLSALEAGAEHVILERTEIENLIGEKGEKEETGRILQLVERVGLENIIFEAETMDHLGWVFKTFGPHANVGPNLNPEDIYQIEPLRHGIGRAIGYTVFQNIKPA